MQHPMFLTVRSLANPFAQGRGALVWAPTTLEGVCYLTVALMLAEKEPIEVCCEPTCGHFFVATDGRQKFCTPACGNRARYRRYQEKAAKAKNSEPM